MATELGSAFISVGLGTNTLAGDVKKAFGSAESSGGDAGKSAGKGFSAGFAGIATAALGALSVGTFLKGAITGAGDLQQSAGAIGSVFKENAADMLKWSQSADSALGLTQNEFNELGTIIGSQLKNGGVAMDQLAPKTNALITTGADLASMFGGTTSEAVEALSSALKGERDPIERYGVSLNQAKIDAEAAALGFAKVGGSFDQTAQQAATLSLISKQTADATGNFAKEGETLAGQQQRMAAGFKDVQTSIGGLFLPALTSVFGFINTNILPSLDKFVASLGDGGLGGAFAPIMAVAGPLFASLASSFGPLVPQVMQLVSSFSPLGLLFQVLTPILPLLATAFTQISGSIAGVLAIVIPLVSQLVSALLPIIVNLVSTVLPPLAAIFGELIAAIAPFVVQIASDLIPIINALLPVVVLVFNLVADVIRNAMQIVQGIIQVVTGIISGDWDKVWTGIGNIFGGIWNTIVAVVKGALQLVGQVVISGLGLIGNFVGSTLSGIGNFFASTWNNVTSGVSGFIGGLINHFTSLPGKIMSALSGAGTWLLSVGQNIVQGLIDGAKGMVGRAVQAIKDVGGAMLDGVKGFLGIKSPSRVFKAEVGMMIGAGVIAGISASEAGVTSAVNDLVAIPQASAFGAGTFMAAGSAAGASFPDRVVLSVDGHEFTAYVSGVSRSELNGVASIAGGRSR